MGGYVGGGRVTVRPPVGPPLSIPGARPTKHISVNFEIRWIFKTLFFKIYAADHNNILHTSRQSVLNFHRISNSTEICLVGRAPGSRFDQCLVDVFVDVSKWREIIDALDYPRYQYDQPKEFE